MVVDAVASVVSGAGAEAADIELIVADNSVGDATEAAVRPLLEAWPGPASYTRNDPPLGMVGNFNRCVELASGRWVHILHDDDYLVPGGLARLRATLGNLPESDRAVLFGVRVVDRTGRLVRRQVPFVRRRLSPKQALRRHLARSSYVRFPAIVVRRDVHAEVGRFDESVKAATDLEMWARVFSAVGLRIEPKVIAAYVVHPAAATERMFTAEYVSTICEIFDRVVRSGVLPEAEVRRAQSHWFHQFVLAGTYRRWRAHDLEAARRVLALFEEEALGGLPPSWRWSPLRLAFALAVGRQDDRESDPPPGRNHVPHRRSGSVRNEDRS
jgi:glycosyltransferase involved in cell wall biosynthesis